MIGRIGLAFLELEGEKFYEAGYRLKQTAWGKGYAAEAVRGCIAYAFENLNQSFVRSLVHPDNDAAIKVAKRVGMHLEKVSSYKDKTVNVYRLARPVS